MDMRERLRAYAQHKGISLYSFCKSAGLASNFITWGTKGMSARAMYRIGQTFPDLNLEWVVTGDGDMLKGEEATIPLSVYNAHISHRDAQIAQLEKTVHNLKEEIKAQR